MLLGSEHLRAREGSPWTSGWRIRGDVSARRLPCQYNRGRSNSRLPLLLRRQELEDSQGLLLLSA